MLEELLENRLNPSESDLWDVEHISLQSSLVPCSIENSGEILVISSTAPGTSQSLIINLSECISLNDIEHFLENNIV